jgi:hypothetical protein
MINFGHTHAQHLRRSDVSSRSVRCLSASCDSGSSDLRTHIHTSMHAHIHTYIHTYMHTPRCVQCSSMVTSTSGQTPPCGNDQNWLLASLKSMVTKTLEAGGGEIKGMWSIGDNQRTAWDVISHTQAIRYNGHACIYIYIYTHVHECMHACVRAWVRSFTHAYIHTDCRAHFRWHCHSPVQSTSQTRLATGHECIERSCSLQYNVCMYVCMHACVRACMYACVYVCAQITCEPQYIVHSSTWMMIYILALPF